MNEWTYASYVNKLKDFRGKAIWNEQVVYQTAN